MNLPFSPNKSLHTLKISTLIGDLWITANDSAVLSITPAPSPSTYDGSDSLLTRAAIEIQEYLAQKRKSFTFPIEMRGTDFSKAVWKEAQKIPYGSTCSYADIALRIGKPGSARAVGQALNRNPLLLVVPCHRVMAKDRSIKRFGNNFEDGIQTKIKPLALEQDTLEP